MTRADAEKLIAMLRRFAPDRRYEIVPTRRGDDDVAVQVSLVLLDYADAVRVFGRDHRGMILADHPPD